MRNNTKYANRKSQTRASRTRTKATVMSAKLCFENLKGNKYKEGYLITESCLKRENPNSPLCNLASFANIIVDQCGVNESTGASYITVSAIVKGKENSKKLYEWIDRYAGKDKAETIAPGLLEALGMKPTTDTINEEEDTVARRFAKYRKLYEGDDVDAVSEDDDDTDDKSDDNSDENTDDNKDDNANNSEEEEEQDELTAIVLEVKKGDEDKLKEELIDAGVDEDDIEIITEKEDDEEEEGDEDNKDDDTEEQNEAEDEDGDKDEDEDETVKVKVAVSSFDALKEYLEGKGFDLEEELGGEIVTDDSDEDEEGGDEEGSKDDLDAEFDSFDDLFK